MRQVKSMSEKNERNFFQIFNDISTKFLIFRKEPKYPLGKIRCEICFINLNIIRYIFIDVCLLISTHIALLICVNQYAKFVLAIYYSTSNYKD